MLPLLLALLMSQPFGPLEQRSHEIMLGVPGSGKTHWARERVRDAHRVVFYGPTRDYRGEGELVAPDELEPYLFAGRFCRLVVEPGEMDSAEGFKLTIAACRRWSGEGLILVGDEVGDYSKRAAEELTRLHRNGHHDGVASILVSQCAVDIPKTCRRTATRFASLLQTDEGDLEALAESPRGPDYAERVRSWRPGDPPAVWTLPTLYRPT